MQQETQQFCAVAIDTYSVFARIPSFLGLWLVVMEKHGKDTRCKACGAEKRTPAAGYLFWQMPRMRTMGITPK